MSPQEQGMKCLAAKMLVCIALVSVPVYAMADEPDESVTETHRENTADIALSNTPTDANVAIQAYNAARGGKWLVLAGAIGMLLVRFLRRGVFGSFALASRVKWFATRWGGYALALVTAGLSVIGVALFAGGSLTWTMVADVFALFLVLVGMHEATGDAARAVAKPPSVSDGLGGGTLPMRR